LTKLNRARGGRAGRLALLGLIATAAFPSLAGAAEFGIVPGSFQVRMLDAAGAPQSLAGSHPDRLQIAFALEVDGTGTTARDLVFDLPPGFGSDPSAVPACPRELFDKGEEECPAESQVGVLRFGPPESSAELPIFVVEPRPGELVGFGSSPGFDVPMQMELRAEDYGVRFRASDLPPASVSQEEIELWGVPADRQQGTSIPRRAFLTTPTRCQPLSFGLATRSWEADAPWLSASFETEPLTGCESLSFQPVLDLELTNPIADSPTGARIDLELPQQDDPDGRATSQLREVTVQLPAGLTVSPGGAAAVAVCSDAELGLGTTAEASCPPSSRIGGVEMSSALLDEPLRGAIYLGEEHPGERFRMFVVVSAAGQSVKFAAALRADPASGRLSVAMADLPQVPIERMTMTIDGGPGALLAAPLECGPSAAVASFAPYSGTAPVDSIASTSIAASSLGNPCPGPGPFAPSVEVAGSDPRAGRATTLAVQLRRRSGEQLPARFAVGLPPGLSAAIGALETCPDSAAASGACPPGSRVGGAVAAVGSGSSLATLPGDAYVTGPYRGAPFGLVLAFRGAIGPFDLGRIAFRSALQLSRSSGRVTVVADRLPAVVEGVEIRFRKIGLSMDRRGLLLNPTSCRPNQAETTIEAVGGASVVATSAFPVSGCRRLGFRPRLSARLTGGRELRRGSKPGLVVSARLWRGDANLRAMTLSLPDALDFDLAAIRAICARPDALAGDCPAASRVGTAHARTPILKRPLRGTMHVVRPRRDGLPELWLEIASMGVRMSLQGRAETHDGRLSIALSRLPDLPMSAVTMRMPGGEGGILSLAVGLCDGGRERRLGAPALLEGQNGKRRGLRVPVRARPRCEVR